ncbi:hypothetical protein [Crateriforma conspicua]|nr:hypothetical protein [Crateriforma conspicua]
MKRHNHRRSVRPRRLGVQPLESRKLMAGDVAVDVDISGSRMDVELTGDGLSNGVEVRQIGDYLHINGLNHGGAATTIEGQASYVLATKFYTGSQWVSLDDLRIELNGGDDHVLIRDVRMNAFTHSDLEIRTGRGNDRITMMDVTVLNDIDLDDDAWQDGNDYWWMRNIDVGGKLEADMGDGFDTFVASYLDADHLDVNSGRHNDYVSLFGIDVDELDVQLSSGNDRLRIDASDAVFADLDGGADDDVLDVNGTGFYANGFNAVAASDNFETIYS